MKLAVVGAKGQMGRIHFANLLRQGCQIVGLDSHGRVNRSQAPDGEYKEEKNALETLAGAAGFQKIILSTPESVTPSVARKAIAAGFKKILIEKPGATSSSELLKLKKSASEKGVDIRMNFQRQIDPVISSLLSDIKQKTEQEGYKVDYVRILSCDARQPPQDSPQALNQGCHDFALLLNIFDAAGGLRPTELKTNAIEWSPEKTDDSLFMQTTGKASSPSGASCLWDIQCGRVSSEGTFTELFIKLSKYLKSETGEDMHEPKEIKLRYPEAPDASAHWSGVWASAFAETAKQFSEEDDSQIATIDFGVEVLRLAEISDQSFQQGGRKFSGIQLLERDDPVKWVSLGCAAQINREALMEPVAFLGKGQVVGCLDTYKGHPAEVEFKNKYASQPMVGFGTIEEMKAYLDPASKVIFYYPTLPGPARDKVCLDLLKSFPSSMILIEKPCHVSFSEVQAFLAQLKEEGISTSRVAVGMHRSLHPWNKVLLDLVKEHKDEIASIDCHFNYPKNPHDPTSYRMYDPYCGGAMLDLGVYVYAVVREIGQLAGFTLKDFNADKKKIWMKKTSKGVDIESIAEVVYGEIEARMETKINPGANHSEELRIRLKNSDEIVANQFCHWHDSCGVFIEHADGSVSEFPIEKTKMTTSMFQIAHLEKVMKGEAILDPSLTLETQADLLEFIHLLKENTTHSNLK